jgi:peptidoglycan/LPS O-acetylase OafA/YrhL
MLAAIFFIQKRSLFKILQGNFGVILCILIAFTGRGAMITGVYNYFGNYSFIVRALAEPLMTFGFALLVLNVITSQSFVRNILETSWILFLGRISYSMYLWHWLISIFISYVIMEFTGLTNVGLQISFLLSTLALIPVSYLSYRYLELPYFKKQHPAATQNNPAF